MELTKIKDKRSGAIRLVKNSLASDFIGTGRFEEVKEKKPIHKDTKIEDKK